MIEPEIGDVANMFGPARTRIAERVARVAFGISAINRNGDRQKLPGSGVFIAPYFALTAKHVMTEVLKLHRGPVRSGDLVSASVRLHQVTTFDRELFRTAMMPAWRVREVIECPYSDLALLDVLPANEAAEQLAGRQWDNAMFRVHMLPPPQDSRVRAFGFPGKAWEFDPETGELDIRISMAMSEGRVAEVFDEWRVEPQALRPAIFGPPPDGDQLLTDFPCFEMTAPVEEGMSGGPVFYGDDLLGVVSSGFELQKGDTTDAARSRVATLWPLILTGNIPTGIDRVSFLTLLQSALIDCPDWRDAEQIAYLDEVHGRMRARRRAS